MAHDWQLRRLVFEGGFDARDPDETASRGYRSHVMAEMTDGTKFRITFYDPVRLQQTLDDDVAAGAPYFAEPGLIIVPEVTLEIMEQAARGLIKTDFFDHLRPVEPS